jgi:16S rRNA (cytosine967-C5)-methyltransferase
VLRRRSDARWRIGSSAPEELAELQRGMIDAAVRCLRPGGVLVYSVCTLTAAESLGVDEHVACRHPWLRPEPPGPPWEPWGRGGLLLPDADHDGMCVFRYRATSAT